MTLMSDKLQDFENRISSLEEELRGSSCKSRLAIQKKSYDALAEYRKTVHEKAMKEKDAQLERQSELIGKLDARLKAALADNEALSERNVEYYNASLFPSSDELLNTKNRRIVELDRKYMEELHKRRNLECRLNEIETILRKRDAT